MTTQCPNGHDSEWADYCSICGDPLGGKGPEATVTVPGGVPGGVVGPAATGANKNSCSNCGEAHGPDDVFCENCGFDFASQTLPDAPVAASAPSAALPARIAVVSVDRPYFDATIGDNNLTFPDTPPDPVEIPLVGAKALIGRYSQSRGIFPEIDIAASTLDPAASSRHAMLVHDDEGNWLIEDLGSTNGTVIGDPSSSQIPAGTLVPVAAGVAIYVGAWTKIEIQVR